jgi:cytidylate kinase
MIITISGTPGSGKSTIARLLAEELGFAHRSAGDFMRAMAKERGKTINELTEIARSDPSIDEEIDRRTVELAERETNFVIDSRLGWYFIPDAVKILLVVDPEVAAQRIFADMRTEEKENTSVEKTKENIVRRLKSEIERYDGAYGVDYADKRKHDLVIDTSALTPEKIVGRIIDFLKKRELI